MDGIEHLRPMLKRGDAEAWRSLVRALAGPLFRYSRPLSRDDDGAEEIVQQTFIRLQRARLKEQGSLRTLAFHIATNLLRDEHRNRTTRQRREQEAAMPEAATDDPQRQAEAKEAWQSAMMLPVELREIVLLRYGEGFTAAEAAAVLGIPEGTVKTRQRRALESLRGSALAAPALLHEGAHATPVPAGLANSVEGIVMAKVGSKTAGGAGLITALLLGGSATLLLLGAAVYMLFQADNEDQGTQPSVAAVASADDEGRSAVTPPVVDNEVSGAGAPPTEPAAGDAPAILGGATMPQNGPEAQAPQEITIRGRVVDQAGKGIPGAEVSYAIGQERVSTKSPSRFLNLGRGTSWLPFEVELSASFERRVAAQRMEHGLPDSLGFNTFSRYHPEPVISDDEGRYEISMPEPRSRSHYGLRALALGYRFASESADEETEPEDDKQVREVTLVMESLGRVAFFRTEPASPHVGARLQTNDQGMTGSSSGQVYDGPDGVHQVALSRALLSRIRITVAGHAPVEMGVQDHGRDVLDLGMIRLPRGRTLSGRVVTTDGKPLASTALRLLSDPPRHAQTHEDGSFTIEGVSDEGALLVARHENLAEAHAEVSSGADDIDGLALTMKPGVKVSVDVRLPRDVDDKIWLALVREMPGPEPHTWNIGNGVELDATGRAVFERVAPGAYQVRAAMGQRQVHQRVDVRSTDAHVNLAFGTGGRVFGTVIDRDGSPLANEQLRLLRLPQQSDDLRARTGADGGYAIEDVADGEYVVVVESRDMGFTESFLASRRVVIADGNAVEMNMDYSQRPLGNVLRGRVTLGGQPRFEGVFLLGAGLTGGTMLSRCEPDGSFEINAIPPGEYYALIAAPGSRNGPRLAIRFDGWDGEHVIERDFQAATLEIRLRGEDVDHTLVRYSLFPHDDQPFGPDAMGLMLGSHEWGGNAVKRIEHLPALRYWLTVSAPGFADAVISVDTIRQREVTIELKRNAGTAVFQADGNAAAVLERAGEDMVRRAAFLLIHRDGAVVARQSFPIQEGELMRATTLAPGSYRALLLGTGIEEAEVAFDVREGESTQVTLPLRPAARVEIRPSNTEITPAQLAQAAVRLYDATSGEPVRPFAHVSAFLGGMQAPAESINIGPLKAGGYRAEIQLPGYQPATLTFQVGSGQEVGITINLEAG